MSRDAELWVAVSVIQSATHGAVQHTASHLIVRYAFAVEPRLASASRLYLHSALRTEGCVDVSSTHTHTNAVTQSAPVRCWRNKQSTHTHTPCKAQSPFPSSSLLLTLASQFASELSHSGLYILFNNILSPRWVPLRADLTVQCAACLLRESGGQEAVRLFWTKNVRLVSLKLPLQFKTWRWRRPNWIFVFLHFQHKRCTCFGI